MSEPVGGETAKPAAANENGRSVLDCLAEFAILNDDFDYSTPEGEAAIRAAIGLVLEVRLTEAGLARKVWLYERTLGVAVVPVLLRRAFLHARAGGLFMRRRR